jgi:hypothetical protein
VRSLTLRGLLPAAVATLALISTDARAQTSVELIEAGAAPQQTIRYRFVAGPTQNATMDMNMQLAMNLGGMQIPMTSVPPVRMTMIMRVAEVAGDGSARLEFALLSAEATGDPAQTGPINRSLQNVKDVSGWYRMDTRGQISEADVSFPEGSASAGELANGLNESIQQLAAPFPDEAVGIGARWRVIQKTGTGGVNIAQTAEYTLRARTANSVTLDVKIIDSAIELGSSLPPEAKLEAMKVEGGGTTTIDLAGLAPTAAMDVNTQIIVSIAAQGQSQNVSLNLQVKQSMAPVAR